MNEPLTLPPEMTIYTVAELRSHCVAWLAEMHAVSYDNVATHVPWRIDAAAVVEVDAAGLQLLQSLAHSVARQHPQRSLHAGPHLQVENPSPAIAGACSALGLTALLGDAAPIGVAA